MFTLRTFRHGTPTQLPTTHGTSIGIQYQANFHAHPLSGLSLQEPAFSRNGFQANRNPRVIPSEPLVNGIRSSSTNNQTIQMRNNAPVNVPFVNAGLLLPPSAQNGLNLGQEARTVGCVLHPTLYNPSLNSAPVCPTGLRS